MTTPSRLRRLPIVLAASVCVLAAAPRPTATPTPGPRLTGGFGKTPAAGSAHRSAEKKTVRITNDSLVTEPDKGKLTTSESRPPATVTPAAGRTGEKTPEASAASEPPEGEEYWRGEARRLRERVAALNETIERLEKDTKKLEGDFYSWDDGAYRDRVIKPAWDKAREELATARRDLPVAQRELAELPDRARKAGALPGWLRE